MASEHAQVELGVVAIDSVRVPASGIKTSVAPCGGGATVDVIGVASGSGSQATNTASWSSGDSTVLFVDLLTKDVKVEMRAFDSNKRLYGDAIQKRKPPSRRGGATCTYFECVKLAAPGYERCNIHGGKRCHIAVMVATLSVHMQVVSAKHAEVDSVIVTALLGRYCSKHFQELEAAAPMSNDVKLDIIGEQINV
ncbi:hypothetical protein ACHHYP_20747 [Achlya hypogyna]|uniref:Uncharacterized protein n=1 Tax=Achlya hypogyna TaxID=1202772 RepID=A0A1V9YCA4_ACHHY|nr:hypothetical protein ACHHYP_20747 [Achlya hypogyna]